MLNRKDLLLLLLYAPVREGGDSSAPIAGRTRLAKMIFIFKMEVWKEFDFASVLPRPSLPKFFAWRFGPFSKDIFEDVDFFRSIDFVKAVPSPDRQHVTPPAEAFERAFWVDADPTSFDSPSSEPGLDEYTEEIFELTPLSRQYIADHNLWGSLSQPQQRALITLKGRFVNAPLYVILKYVYTRYPTSIEQSTIIHEVLG